MGAGLWTWNLAFWGFTSLLFEYFCTFTLYIPAQLESAKQRKYPVITAWWFNKAEPALFGHNVATAQVEKHWSENSLLIFLDRKTFDDHVYKRVITRRETLKSEKVERDAYTGERFSLWDSNRVHVTTSTTNVQRRAVFVWNTTQDLSSLFQTCTKIGRASCRERV